MFDRKAGIKYAQDFVDQIVAKGLNLKYAKLFGSTAKNNATSESDIDILLVASEFTGIGFIDNALIAEELIKFDIIQVKTYQLSDYEEGDPLTEEINRTSINLNIN